MGHRQRASPPDHTKARDEDFSAADLATGERDGLTTLVPAALRRDVVTSPPEEGNSSSVVPSLRPGEGCRRVCLASTGDNSRDLERRSAHTERRHSCPQRSAIVYAHSEGLHCFCYWDSRRKM
ncbi:hypothetical protein Bbelb_230080 [Branchiostoma belcheri]|nr:hypothetical protein Bbelb_230080 [Branchiostoma belcheri]